MTSFIFPLSNIPQNVEPQRVVTDADIDPALLAWRPPQQTWPSPLPLPPPPPIQADASIDPALLARRLPQQTYTSQLPLPLPPLPPSAPIQIQAPSSASHANHSTTISQSTSLQAPRAEDHQSPPAPEPEPNPSIANTHSWAGRNPSRPVIEPRSHKPKLTDAQKASRAIVRQQKQASTKKLDDAIKMHVEEQIVKITELAAAHSTSVERVKAMVGVNTHYKKSRKPALHNAILHAQAERVNSGKV
jgi:hypothetical protein